MQHITTTQVRSACSLASAVYDKKLTAAVAKEELHEKLGLNKGSAQDFISQYRAMMEGRVFKRSISVEAGGHFLESILESRGGMAADNAVAAVWKHIAYYESLKRGNLNKLRAVVASFAIALTDGVSLATQDAEFSASVAESIRDSEARRNDRLNVANPTPQTTVVVTRAFKRNPDVVAAVLSRAEGRCEKCKKLAPFAKKSNGSPYLEVHHRTQLAHGGFDTVKNAIALCPNCHRQQHHG